MELNIHQALQEGVAAHKQGKIQDAERLYRAILKFQHFHPEANHNLGVLAVNMNKVGSALPLFKRALKANPKIEQFWLSYIDALVQQMEFKTAKEIIKLAKEHGFDSQKFNSIKTQLRLLSQSQVSNSTIPSKKQLNILLQLYQNGRHYEAENLAKSFTYKFPKHKFGWKVLGAIYGQSGRISEALSANRSVVALSPQDAEGHNNLGNTLKELGKLDEAEKSYMEAIRFKSNYSEAYSNLGNTLKELGRLEEAEINHRQAIKLKPNYAEAYSNLGVTLQELGKLDEAEVSYRKAIVLKPDCVEAYSNLGVTLQKLNRLHDAETNYKHAIKLIPNYAEAHNNLGNTLKELGKLDEAEKSYMEAIRFKSNYSEAYSNLGNTLKELGRLEEAEINHRQAIKLKPNYAEAYSNLGVTLQELGKLDEAEVSYRKAIVLKPNHTEALSNLGNALIDLGRFDEAVNSLQQAFASRSLVLPVGDKLLAPATTGLFFELTNRCNFHCVFCPSDSQKRNLGSMDIELVKRLYEEAADKKIASQVNLHLMGEPTLHPKLIDILKFGASKNIKTDLVTNGSTLVAKVVPKILDALYGTITASHMTPTEETYHFRGKVGLSWGRYISNLRLLVTEYVKRLAKGETIKNNITIRVMVTQNTAANVKITETENEARAILKEWNDFVALVEKEMGMFPFKRQDHNAKDLLQANKHASISYPLQKGIKLTFWRAFTFANTRVNKEFDLKDREKAYCHHPFTDVGVLWNGDVTLCCLDHDGQLKVGNIKDSSIETLIQSEQAKKLRASMLGNHPIPSVCKTCQAKPVKRVDAIH